MLFVEGGLEPPKWSPGLPDTVALPAVVDDLCGRYALCSLSRQSSLSAHSASHVIPWTYSLGERSLAGSLLLDLSLYSLCGGL